MAILGEISRVTTWRRKGERGVALIVPVLNREERLVDVLEQVQTTLADLSPEVVVVCDVTPGLLGALQSEQRELEERFAIRSVTLCAVSNLRTLPAIF